MKKCLYIFTIVSSGILASCAGEPDRNNVDRTIPTDGAELGKYANDNRSTSLGQIEIDSSANGDSVMLNANSANAKVDSASVQADSAVQSIASN